MAKNTEPQRATLPIKSLKKARYNPRKISKKELQKLVESIKTYGLVQPILVNKDHTIIGGHQRVEACRQLGIETVDVYILDLSRDDEKALNLALNRIGGAWDEAALHELLGELAEKNKVALTGFDAKELEKLRFKQGNKINRKLIQDYIIPPFTIFDTKQGYWQQRKAEWILQLGDSGDGRADDLLGSGLKKLTELKGATLTGTSVFDPVLTEVIYTWFAEAGGMIADPFAGGHVRGLVASRLGYKYVGTDVSKVQIAANKKRAKELDEKGATWVHASGEKLGEYVENADLVFTCPPYYDLEQYDKTNPHDISNAPNYAAFKEVYAEILTATYKVLKKSGWAIVVVGNIRDEHGNYHNLVGDTVEIMRGAGYDFYNEAILATALGTAMVRARKTFDGGKKLVKTHQNILFFAKGKEVAINSALRELLLSGLTATAHHDVLIFKK